MLVLVDPGAGLLPVMPPSPLLAMGPTVGHVESQGDFGARIRHKHGQRQERFSTGCGGSGTGPTRLAVNIEYSWLVKIEFLPHHPLVPAARPGVSGRDNDAAPPLYLGRRCGFFDS